MNRHPFNKGISKRKGGAFHAGEPKTKEGRARKKLQMGLAAGFGCVLSHEEMKEVINALPREWLSKENR